MPAIYPGSIRSFSTKIDLTDTVFALHMNDVQSEITAIQSTLGTNPHIGATTSTTVSDRAAALETGKSATTHTHDTGAAWVGLTIPGHDIDTRHTFGAALGNPVTPSAIVVGAAGSAGSGVHPAKEDHIHPMPSALSLAASVIPPGTIIMFGGGTAPAGWALCDGASYPRGTTSSDTYYNLYQAIGTAYGTADSTHFNVPDFRQRMPLGKAASGTGSTLGATGGSKDMVVPQHSHPNTLANANADHQHYTDHTHTTGWSGNHKHPTDPGMSGYPAFPDIIAIRANTLPFRASDTGSGWMVTFTRGDTLLAAAPDHNHGNTGWMIERQYTDLANNGANHGHALTNNNAGVSATDANLPPYVVVNFLIKL
jgi:microcystin-dependent protein